MRPAASSPGPNAFSGTPVAAGDILKTRLFFSLIAAALVFIFLYPIHFKILSDQDMFWHVKTGMNILNEFRLPSIDTYTHTQPGEPWFAKEWMAQILFGSAYILGGWSGVVKLSIAFLMLTGFFICWFLQRHLRPPLAVGIALLVMLLILPTFWARPHILSFPLIVIWTAVLLDAAASERAPPFVLLIVLVVWANMHAGFSVAFAIIAFSFFDFLQRAGFRNKDSLLRWIAFGALCPLSILINPYGYLPIVANLNVAIGNPAVKTIAEWQPFTAWEDPSFEISILIIVLFFATTSAKTTLSRGLLMIFVMHMMFLHKRFVYVFGIITPFILAPDLARIYPRLSASQWARADWGVIERTVARFILPIAGLGIAALTACVLLGISPTLQASARVAAPKAIEFAKRHNLAERPVFNAYQFGGVLIFEDIKTFIDGRTDQLFLGDFYDEFWATRRPAGKAAFEEILEKYDIGWVLLPRHDNRIVFLEQMPGWQQAFSDESAVIYVKRQAEAAGSEAAGSTDPSAR